ncbi:unnamed protein product (macronuclear) [Paramecium tetraurelia]|uniref:Longin domain-containing protein n=1 Tax=Paramecium tetraurelia TaxID=5888 RepID=A0CPU6_PARTE|nr:uncharacterized protein GSPATT00009205001 [Paramecium tetraurelia]CAK72813.1 unnamed protein product [Paramecium tetraurelia]|eukprot:XP_001440210.1 hypothetical protein (macronuclear) [Paramecium tetraurelia strain d4-2]
MQPNNSRTSIFAQTNVNNPPLQGQNAMNSYAQTYSGIFQQQSQSNIQSQQQQNLQPIVQQQQLQQQQYPQYQQQQQLQQQQQQQQIFPNNNQQQQQIDQNPSNIAQYNQQFQPIYQEPDNFTNPNAIPQKIDLQFYGIYEKVYYIKAYLLLRFKNWQILYHYNHTKKNTAESHAKIIVKNFQEFTQLEYDVTYVVSTDEGFWILKITDLDRIYMVLYDNNFRRDLAFQVFEEYYKCLTEQEQLVKIQDNIELYKQINEKLEMLTQQYEQKIIENKETGLNFEYSKVDFSQAYFSIGLSEQCQMNNVEKVILQTQNNRIHPAFQGTNLFTDLKSNLQPIISICICVLLILIVILLLYNYVIKDILTSQQSNSGKVSQKHLLNHLIKK